MSSLSPIMHSEYVDHTPLEMYGFVKEPRGCVLRDEPDGDGTGTSYNRDGETSVTILRTPQRIVIYIEDVYNNDADSDDDDYETHIEVLVIPQLSICTVKIDDFTPTYRSVTGSLLELANTLTQESRSANS